MSKAFHRPYSIFKYNPDTNSYVEVPAALDSNAKTLTVTVASLADPLFAIGGNAAAKTEGMPASSWAILVVAIIIILVLVVFLVTRFRTRVER